MNHTGTRMSESQEFLYVLHAVTFTEMEQRDRSVLFYSISICEQIQ
ncbi:hypothetical protein [Planococcus lenghuensis]|nr:hypothetical protein [Planococcus lenghuensis]